MVTPRSGGVEGEAMDFITKSDEIERLGQRASRPAFDLWPPAKGATRHDHHGCGGILRTAVFEQFSAVCDRHLEVTDHQVRALLLDHQTGRESVVRRGDLKTAMPEIECDGLANFPNVVDHENSGG